MKRVRSSRLDLHRAGSAGWAKKRRFAAALERRLLLAAVLLVPALYTLSHAVLFGGTSASRGGGQPSVLLPPPSEARCGGAAAAGRGGGSGSTQGWTLLDELQQLKYTRALLQARRDAALQASSSNSSNQSATFLFIGVNSAAGNRAERDAAREAWLQQANRVPGVTCRFFIYSTQNATEAPEVQQEVETLGDTVLVAGPGFNSTMAHRTYSLVEHALGQHSPQFILKAEDSTFVNVPALMTELRANCRNPGCHMERLYFGREMNSTRSQQQVDAAYAAHTSLKAYMPYMLGGGYVLSADLAKVILETNQQQGGGFLKFMPNEDISIGVWLMSLDLRRIDHPQVRSLEGCSPEQLDQAKGSCATHICSPWRPALMLQHVPGAAAMRRLGAHLRQCSQQEQLLTAARQLSALQLSAQLQQLPPGTEGAVLHVSPPDSVSQYLLGGYAGRIWSPDGQQLLALRVPDGAAQPGHARVEIGVFARQTGGGWRWEQINSAAAWNSRRGPMLQWLGPTSRYIVFNDRACNATGGSSNPFPNWVLPWEQQGQGSSGKLCAVVYDMQQMTRSRSLPVPVFAVSPDGRLAAAINFERLEAAAAGTGYLPAQEPTAAAAAATPAAATHTDGGGSSAPAAGAPATGLSREDGLWLVDVVSGQQQLVASLQQLFTAVRAVHGRSLPAAAGTACRHWVDTPLFSPGSAMLAFTYHIGHCSNGQQPQSHVFVAEAPHAAQPAGICSSSSKGAPQQLGPVRLVPLNGSAPRPPSLSFMPSGQLLVCSSTGFHEVNPCSMHVSQLVAPAALMGGEPTSCSVGGLGGRHVLVSSRTSTNRRRRLVVWDRLTGGTSVIGEYTSSAEGRTGFSHVGLQPMWGPDGTSAVFDSSHNGQGWQVYQAALAQQGSGKGVSVVHGAGSDGHLPGAGQGSFGLSALQNLPAGHSQPRRVYIDLGSQGGSSVLRYLERHGQKERIQVYAWEPDPRHLEQLQQVLQPHAAMHSISVLDLAAWTADSRVAFYPFAVSMPPGAPGRGQQAGSSGEPSLWQRLNQLFAGESDTRSGSMFAPPSQQQGKAEVDGSSNSSSGSRGSDAEGDGTSEGSSSSSRVTVMAADFAAWLQQNVEPDDDVTVHMDIAGAEFDVLSALIRDGSIALVDKLAVAWNTELRPEFVDWPAAYSNVFKTLGIHVEA